MASFIEMSNGLGTLEAGKLADVVILGGRAPDSDWNLLNSRVVGKGGLVMASER